MAFDGLALHVFGLLLVLHHLAVPVLVEVANFFEVGHLDLPLLLLEPEEEFLLALFFEFLLDLGQSFLGSLCFEVLASLFGCLLVRVENFAA